FEVGVAHRLDGDGRHFGVELLVDPGAADLQTGAARHLAQRRQRLSLGVAQLVREDRQVHAERSGLHGELFLLRQGGAGLVVGGLLAFRLAQDRKVVPQLPEAIPFRLAAIPRQLAGLALYLTRPVRHAHARHHRPVEAELADLPELPQLSDLADLTDLTDLA